MQHVDDPLELVLHSDRDVDGDAPGGELLLDLPERPEEVRALAVEHVHDQHAREAELLGELLHARGPDLEAHDARDDDQGPFDHAEGAARLALEGRVAGAVEQVDLAALPLRVRERERDRDLAVLLVLVGVGDRGAGVDRAEPVHLARLEEERLHERRLARPPVADDGDVADLAWLGCSHLCAFLLVSGCPGMLILTVASRRRRRRIRSGPRCGAEERRGPGGPRSVRTPRPHAADDHEGESMSEERRLPLTGCRGGPAEPPGSMDEHVISGRYRPLEQLGRGGMGVVWRARDLRLGRVVAIKVLHPWVADDPELRERFEREAAALARLEHPNVVRLYDVLEDRGQTVLVMELVEGEALDTRLAGGPQTWDEARKLCAPVAAALAHAHARGVVHRDLTPANVLVERGSGRLVVTDFGLARLARSSRSAPVSGVLAGTPEYWAPGAGLWGGQTGLRARISTRSAASLPARSSGRLPFEGEDRLATGLRRAHEAAPSLATVAPACRGAPSARRPAAGARPRPPRGRGGRRRRPRRGPGLAAVRQRRRVALG